jgi:hypothetical protein
MRQAVWILVALSVSTMASGCATGTTRCTGNFPKSGDPGVYTCHDVSMSEQDAVVADDWTAESKGRNHTMADECAFWGDKLQKAPATSPGLTQYVQINRSQACETSDKESAAGAKRDAADREAGKAWLEMADGEIARGTCDPGYREALEQLLMRMKTNLAMRRDEGNTLHMVTFVDHRILVAKEAGSAFEFADWANSTVHVFAIAGLPVTLDVHRGADAITLQSPWSRGIHWRATLTGAENNAGTTLRIVHPKLGEPLSIYTRELDLGMRDTIALDSRVVQARAGESLKITVKGRGCALLAAFRDLN